MHLLQVGLGSGGMAVLDCAARDERVTRVTLIDRDSFEAHNVSRHLFGHSAVGERKTDAAASWLRDRRPDLRMHLISADLTDSAREESIGDAAASADVGVCAADNETAKYAFDRLMRRHRLPWTLGEVLAGGIGGFVHTFAPGGPCYGCVASYLQRKVELPEGPRPDYASPGAAVEQARVPASRTDVAVIAALHAQATEKLLCGEAKSETLLFPMRPVAGLFAEAYRPVRFKVTRGDRCLVCRAAPTPADPRELDKALEAALQRLGR